MFHNKINYGRVDICMSLVVGRCVNSMVVAKGKGKRHARKCLVLSALCVQSSMPQKGAKRSKNGRSH